MDGDEVAIRLRESGRSLVLVAVTARNDNTAILRIATAGFDFHWVKPVDPHNLTALISSLIPLVPLEDSEPSAGRISSVGS